MLKAISSSRPLEPARAARAYEFAAALDHACQGIRDPIVKLRYIRDSLARYQLLLRIVNRLPCSPLRRAIYRWLSLEGMQHLILSHPLGSAVTSTRRVRRALIMSRLAAIGATFATFTLLGVAFLAVLESRPVATETPSPATRPARLPAKLPSPPQLPVMSEVIDPAPSGTAPKAIWLVEKGAEWEQFSNGLRIDTTFQTRTEPRRFRAFGPEGMLPTVQRQPVGILFHTSESDIWPLEANFNENLRDSTVRLLRYIRRLSLYHYLVDRFGRVYRVVEETDKANHSGFSVWAQNDTSYLNLNHAFFGICFESRWEGGVALPITQAQFAAGRMLTEYLRQRYNVSPDMCVAHGLVSVNPHKHLIGHHLDWSRGFPFKAFGLPDQYERPLPSVERFGFDYDESLLAVLGQPWTGVRKAEDALKRAADERGVDVAVIRKERRALYDQWLDDLTKYEKENKLHPAEAEEAHVPLVAAQATPTPTSVRKHNSSDVKGR
ncbi:MAG: N-acetylmuramoyl-L-alanine amidase [Vicinamibacteria bacterium]|jgi:hypothetical protein|nr:N-acetylmuramoyl-L-alanine amidase [Vicinamibacteria bacterium]